MPVDYNAYGYPVYVPSNHPDDDYYLRPVVPSPRPSPRPSPAPSPQPSPNLSPMYLDEYYNYIQPGTGVVGVPMMPAGIIPLPPSPSMLAAAFVPLPPSPNASPRLGTIPLSPHSPGGMLGAYPMYQQPRYTYPYDYRYYFDQAGMYYNNPQYPPRTSVHPILKDSYNIHLDLSSYAFKPQMPSGNFISQRYIPLHQGYMSQIATYPSTSEIRITCKALSRFADVWAIRVRPGRTVSVGDVLRAVHDSLYQQMTHAEWAMLTDRECYEAGKAYTRRCRSAEFERLKGVRRVDLLGGKHWFGGLKKARDDDPHNFELLVKAE